MYNQCSNELRVKVEGTSGYKLCKKENNVIAVLTMIRGYCCQFDALNNEYVAIVTAIKNLLYFFWKATQTNSDYQEDFLAMVEVVKEYSGAGSLTYFPNMIKKEVIAVNAANNNMGAMTRDETKEAKKIVRDKFLAALMLSGANCDRYGDLKRSMAENYVTGTSKYPKSPEVVLCIINAYLPPAGWNRRVKQGRGGEEGAMFTQSINDSWKNNITCHKCGKKGHFAQECCSKGDGEKSKSKENNHVHANVDKDNDDEDGKKLFIQHKKPKKGVVEKNYLLLDNQSTMNQVANPNLLKNIRKGGKPIIVHCNTGSTKTNLIGELGRMAVHHNPRSIVNVLSLKSVAARHRMTYDSKYCGGVFQVHIPTGVVECKPREHGLHYLDMAEHGDSIQHMLVTATGDHKVEDSKDEEEGNEDEEEGK